MEAGEAGNTPVRVGSLLSSDLFYHPRDEMFRLASDMGILAVEMEAAGLFGVAAQYGARAAAIVTVSDLLEDESAGMSPEERETALDTMIGIALDASASG